MFLNFFTRLKQSKKVVFCIWYRACATWILIQFMWNSCYETADTVGSRRYIFSQWERKTFLFSLSNFKNYIFYCQKRIFLCFSKGNARETPILWCTRMLEMRKQKKNFCVFFTKIYIQNGTLNCYLLELIYGEKM